PAGGVDAEGAPFEGPPGAAKLDPPPRQNVAVLPGAHQRPDALHAVAAPPPIEMGEKRRGETAPIDGASERSGHGRRVRALPADTLAQAGPGDREAHPHPDPR